MPSSLIIVLIATAVVGAVLALLGLRAFGVLLALLAPHYAYYDDQLRGCYDETCDRFNYLFPLLLAHLVALCMVLGITIRRHWKRRKRSV